MRGPCERNVERCCSAALVFVTCLITPKKRVAIKRDPLFAATSV
jgi:hypothetical protein